MRPATAFVATLLLAAAGLAIPRPAAADETTALYLVQVAAPLPAEDLGEASARRRGQLRDALIARSGVPSDRVVHRYGTAYPGYAARLTAVEAARTARIPGVVAVTRDEQRAGLSVSTPEFLGLTGETGAWQRYLGGAARAGENAIIGFIDSGLAAGHPSFAPLAEPRPDATAITGRWQGVCTDAGLCNNKVIGARHFRAGATDVSAAEFDSPRDYHGHGTHVAAVAAGDHGVPAVVEGQSAGATSGVAPAARIAVYKALWQTTTGRLAGSTADIVAAIDQATSDGVDVLNYSAAGATGTVGDPVSVALYRAAAAGVFISAAAGNDGRTGTVGSIAPWVTTVAAGTHDRVQTRALRLGDGTTLTGAGQGEATVPNARIVDPAANAAAPADAALCKAGTLNPAAVAGGIVLCRRGVTGRTDKSRAVRDAGGVGMVLYNDPDSTLDTDLHAVPTVHLNRADGLRVKAYAATAGATARIDAATRTSTTAPAVATTSSAGPAGLPRDPILKPDLLAPGVGVLAATAVAGAPAFDVRSGSSVAAAQVSGAGALLLGRSPTMTPAAVRSALMLTAQQTDNRGVPILRGTTAANPLDYGAGHVRPALALDPGLVVEATPATWLAFVCDVEPSAAPSFSPAGCAGVPARPARNLNQPTLSDGAVTHAVTFTRTLSNVTNQASAYFSSVKPPLGYTMSVSPSTVTVLPRRTATVTVTVTRDDPAPQRWEFGEITFSDLRSHVVRLPVAVRAVQVDAPDRIRLDGADGATSIPVTSGFTGTLNAAILGPAPAERGSAVLDPLGPAFNPSVPAASHRTAVAGATIPAGGFARFTTRATEQAGADVDIYVYRQTTTGWTLAAAGNRIGGDEEVIVDTPGNYRVYYHLYAAGAPGPVQWSSWSVSAPTGAIAVTPTTSAVAPGSSAPLTISWQGLLPTGDYVGALLLDDGTTQLHRTLIEARSGP